MGERAIVWQCSGVGFAYDDASAQAPVPALTAVDIVLRRGEMLALLGAEGSGTSTLCRLAAGLLSERGTLRGSVQWGAEEWSAAHPSARSAMLGDDPEAQLTGMTTFVDDEVRLPRRLHGLTGGPDPLDALTELGVAHLSARRLETLSGGERQLVALASLMSLRPALLVLDQPALSLDPDARRRLTSALRRYCDAGGAVLLSGHQHDELSSAADRIGFVRDGTVACTVPSAAVLPSDLDAAGVWNTVPGGGGASGRSAEWGGRPGEDSSVPLLQVADLRVALRERVLIDGFELSLDAGDVMALIGANGVGKSTLLRAIAGLLDDEARVSGSIRGAGERGEVALDHLPAYRRARHVGWVGQDPSAQLSASSARSELERGVPLPPHRRRERTRLRAERSRAAAELLEAHGLLQFADTHPFDLGPAERKDLVIASAQLLGAPVLLLDEPTLGRDLGAMRRLERTIQEHAAGGGAVILTTHDIEWARSVAREVVRLGG